MDSRFNPFFLFVESMLTSNGTTKVTLERANQPKGMKHAYLRGFCKIIL